MWVKRPEMIKYYNVYVSFRGIAPRCRKVDYHTEKIAEEVSIDASEQDIAVLKNKALDYLIKCKAVGKAELLMRYVESEAVGHERYQLFMCPKSKHIPLTLNA